MSNYSRFVAIPAWLSALALFLITALVAFSIARETPIYIAGKPWGIVKEKPSVAGSGELQPVVIGENLVNKDASPLLVFGFCNGTREKKTIEGFLRSPDGSNSLVVSESGVERGSISFVVPPNWEYSVNRTGVANIGCEFNQWLL